MGKAAPEIVWLSIVEVLISGCFNKIGWCSCVDCRNGLDMRDDIDSLWG